MNLLDLLEQYRGWTIDAGGQMWDVDAFIRQFTTSAPLGDRGPEVAAEPSVDTGAVAVIELDAGGCQGERIGLLFPTGLRW
jgi:hypothetical protein